MSEKKYPTRMHEVLGVETNELFAIKGSEGRFYLNYSGDFRFVRDLDKWTTDDVNPYSITKAVNYGITRRPRLTEEQVKELKALLVFDKKWLVKEVESLGAVMAFSEKPEREEDGGWWSDDIEHDFVMTLPLAAAVNSLVSSSDNVPLDIVQTLRDAGVEIEEDK